MKLLSSLNFVRSSLSSWKLITDAPLPGSIDDDLSTTSLQSTVTVDRQDTNKAPPSSRRRVRFADAEDDVIHYPASHHCHDDDENQAAALWYSQTELKQCKAVCHSTAKAVGRNLSPLLAGYSYATVLLQVYDACCQTLTERSSSPLSSQERHALQVALQASGCDVIGLETLAVPIIRLDKQTRRAHVVDAVLALQAQPDASAASMAAVAQSITLAPRLYARVVAQAQAATTAV